MKEGKETRIRRMFSFSCRRERFTERTLQKNLARRLFSRNHTIEKARQNKQALLQIRNSPQLETDSPTNDKVGNQSQVDKGDAGFRQIRQDVQDPSGNLLASFGGSNPIQNGVSEGKVVWLDALIGIGRGEDRQRSGVVDDLHGGCCFLCYFFGLISSWTTIMYPEAQSISGKNYKVAFFVSKTLLSVILL